MESEEVGLRGCAGNDRVPRTGPGLSPCDDRSQGEDDEAPGHPDTNPHSPEIEDEDEDEGRDADERVGVGAKVIVGG